MTTSPEYEEWRLDVELDESRHSPEAVINRVQPQLGPNVAIHKSGRCGFRLYAGSRTHIDKAEKLVRARLDAWRLDATFELTRWNPGAERWQAPMLPIQLPTAPLPDPWLGLDEMAWEVRLRFASDSETTRIADALRDEGIPVLEGRKRCLIALPDEEAARQRADELRVAEPKAAIEVRPLSRFRKWQIRQRVFGNYAGSYDARDSGSAPA